MAAIVAGDLIVRLSVKTGSAGDSTASSGPASLGKYVSTTAAGTALHDLFDVVSGAENAASTVDYRAVFLLNNNAANVYENAGVYISAETAGGASIAIAVDSVAASAKGASAAQALEVATETTAPAALTFTSPTTSGTALSLGNIGIGQVKAIWVRRTATNSAALNADGGTLTFIGDTGAL